MKINQFIEELKRRNVFRVATAYANAGLTRIFHSLSCRATPRHLKIHSAHVHFPQERPTKLVNGADSLRSLRMAPTDFELFYSHSKSIIQNSELGK